MSSTAQLEMRIHKVKDKLGGVSARIDKVEKQLEDFYATAFETKELLAELRSKL
jgi:CII-binding regulator of phage lambda lysogenization HflD